MSSGRGQLVRLVSLEGSLIVVTSSHHQSVVDIVPTHFTKNIKQKNIEKKNLRGSDLPFLIRAFTHPAATFPNTQVR
jgi:hypothetical protein